MPAARQRFAIAVHGVGGERYDRHASRRQPYTDEFGIEFRLARANRRGCLVTVHFGHLTIHQHDIVRPAERRFDSGTTSSAMPVWQPRACNIAVQIS